MTVKRLLSYTAFVIATSVCLVFCAYKKEEEKKEPPIPVATEWRAPVLPKSMSFAGETVPLERREIQDQLDHELVLLYYSPGTILYITKLSQRWFPMIEERLKANGIPDDFKYLCVAESNLQNAISRVGAVGFWQFMPATAPAYGLEVGDQVDERYHVLKATDAACKYFKQAYDKLGSWTAAAASYNCGQGGYNTQAIFQKNTNYYDLLLPEETTRYIFRILTFKYLLQNAQKLGYIVDKGESYAPLKLRSITVSKSIPNLADWAIQQGVTYKILKLYNPWLRDRSLTIKAGKEYTVMLP